MSRRRIAPSRAPSAWLLVSAAVLAIAFAGDHWGRTGGWVSAGLLAAALLGMSYGAWVESSSAEEATTDGASGINVEIHPGSDSSPEGRTEQAVEDGQGQCPSPGEGATAARTNLVRAVLRGADLAGADLRGADLTAADLRGANLAGADLTDTVLRKAKLGPVEE